MKINKKTLGKAVTLGMCLSIAMAFTACGSGNSSGSESTKKSELTYTVATEPTYPPFDTTNDDGELVGFDMDLIKAIGKDQGFKVKFKNSEFDALIPSLKSGDSDIVIAGMKTTPERTKQVDASDTYYDSGNYVMVKKDNNKITGYESFKKGGNYVIAVQTGTTCQDTADKLKKEGRIKKVDIQNQFTTCVEELRTGTVDAVIVDKPVGDEVISKQKGQFKLVGKEDPDTKGSFAIFTKKGNTKVMKKINAGLKDVREDGTFDKLLKKWNMKAN